MSKVINLRTARKRVARQSAKMQADENAVRFGERKAHRTARAEKADQAKRHLDGHKREP